MPVADQVGAFKDLQKQGKVRHIGLSEVTVDELKEAQKTAEIVSVQNLYNLADRRAEALLDHAEANGIGFIPWFPLATGGPSRTADRSPNRQGAGCDPVAARPRLAAQAFPCVAADPRYVDRLAPRGQHRCRRHRADRRAVPGPVRRRLSNIVGSRHDGGMHPLRELTLEDLRRRTSIKWREYDPDVLPLWVAEMDVRLPTPSLVRCRKPWPTGTPAIRTAPRTPRRSRVRRRSLVVERCRSESHGSVADVMTGIVEALGLVSSPGDPVVVNPPVYPPFFGFVEHAGRDIVEALLATVVARPDALEAAFIHARSSGRWVTYLRATWRTRSGRQTAEELMGRGLRRRTTCGLWSTRSMRRWWWTDSSAT